MQRLIEAMKRQAAEVANTRGVPRWGFVESVDPTRPAVRVLLQPENALTGWLPIAQQGAGGNATSVTIPVPGWQALVVSDTGDIEHGTVVGFAHSDAQQIPATPNAAGTGGTPNGSTTPYTAGETVLASPGGSVVRLGAGGSLYLKPGGGTVAIDGSLTVNGNLTVQQNITAVQNITDLNGAHGTMGALRTAYDTHTHQVPNVQAGSSTPTTTITNEVV